MKKFAFILFGVFCTAFCPYSYADLGNIVYCEIENIGIFQTVVVGKEAAGNSTEGKLNRVKERHHKFTTTEIPAKLGTSFGFTYKLKGSSLIEKIRIRKVTIVPGEGILNENTGKKQNEWFQESAIIPNQSYFATWTFDEHDLPIPKGNWIVQLWHDNRLIAEKVFNVK